MVRGVVVQGLGGMLAAACWVAPALAEPPTLVAAYTQQLVRQCGGELTPALASQLVQQIDLNGDKLDDWVVDASRYPCPNRPAVFKDEGYQVTVFLSRTDGRALPALQRVAFGSRIEGKPETGYSLWLTLGGSDCGEESPKARCDRRVIWRENEHRLDLVDMTPKAAPKPTQSPLKK
jgi:hypothetical protein